MHGAALPDGCEDLCSGPFSRSVRGTLLGGVVSGAAQAAPGDAPAWLCTEAVLTTTHDATTHYKHLSTLRR